MSNYVPTKHHLREVLLLFLNSKKSAAESHRLFPETYSDYTLSTETYFDTDDKECPSHPKEIKDGKLETLLDEDPYQTQDVLVESLVIDCSTISRRLHSLAMVRMGALRIVAKRRVKTIVYCEQLL